MLKRFGFAFTFVDSVQTILLSTRLFVIINGTPQGFFSCSSGIRQGDPLSPLLFCLVEEVLNKVILYLVNMGLVKSIAAPLCL